MGMEHHRAWSMEHGAWSKGFDFSTPEESDNHSNQPPKYLPRETNLKYVVNPSFARNSFFLVIPPMDIDALRA